MAIKSIYVKKKEKKSLSISVLSGIFFTASALMSLLLVACSSPPAPTQKIQLAEAAITHAEQAQVADSTSLDLTEAREKLTAARAAVVKKDMATARQLAEQSALNADLAAAKAATIKAKTVNEEMKKSTVTLKQEMQRNSGDKL